MDKRTKKVVMLVIATIALTGLALIITLSCSSSDGGPSGVAQKYVTLMLQKRYADAYKLVAAADRARVSYRDFGELAPNDAVRGDVISSRVEIVRTGHSDRVRVKAYVTRKVDTLVQSDLLWRPEFELSRSASGSWQVNMPAIYIEMVPRLRDERVIAVAEAYGTAWVKGDSRTMASYMSQEYLRSTYGAAPYVEKLQQMRVKWERKHGKLLAIACAYNYVRYTGGTRAVVPAKFCCDPTGLRIPAYVPYTVRLTYDTKRSKWQIAALQQDAHYRVPADAPHGKVSPEVRQTIKDAEALGINGKSAVAK